MAAGVLKAYQGCSTANHLSKRYPTPAGELTVLRDVSLSLDAGDACVGDGAVRLGQEHAALHPGRARAAIERHRSTRRRRSRTTLAPNALAAFRNRGVGFVLQDHCLLPQCTVLENVLVPTLVGEADREPRRIAPRRSSTSWAAAASAASSASASSPGG
jgi:lipoprotein-releasing system ATP-binding protein